ncbi:MAG: rRNA pseudouridine synthase [Candidatus Rokubacteria bacterium]|nr:rRNA pseudouridine synthase [Candidatus Rokubacteria bacterium]
MSMTRLSKILAEAGLASRRGSERLISDGRVTINGTVVTAPGTPADPLRDRITVDGQPLPPPEPKRYLLLHKPRGYVTSRRDPRQRPVVLDLVRDARVRLFPVGRLDFDCEGLLLLTNDGELAHRLLHPRFGVPRVYETEVEGRVTAGDLGRFRQGVVLEDGVARPSDVRVLRQARRTTWLRLTFTEGRYREVKRVCAALGHRVVRLRRVQFGPLRLGPLAPGAVRPLTREELRRLRAAAGP